MIKEQLNRNQNLYKKSFLSEHERQESDEESELNQGDGNYSASASSNEPEASPEKLNENK